MNPLSKFKIGALIVHIMYHAQKEPFFGSWLKSELESHGYEISYGTIYPWLNKLTESGFLSVEERNDEGTIRKYYSITEQGLEEYRKIKRYLQELYKEVMEEQD